MVGARDLAQGFTVSRLRLHGYWRSTASWRVRIALGLKSVEFERADHDLRKGEQRSPAFLSLSPQGLVPALEVGGDVLFQSMAILEWIEERFPEPALLPRSPTERALVRGMAQLVACDIHPLNNLRVLQALRADFSGSEEQIRTWAGRWIEEGFSVLEQLVERHGGAHAFGDQPSLADCTLIPQIFSARRFGVEMAAFPRLLAVEARAAVLPAFAAAHPAEQPDADPPAI